MSARIVKQIQTYRGYHALGNDYIVLYSDSYQDELSPDMVRLICHRNYGVGADSFLVETLGGTVSCKVEKEGGIVTVQMGEVSFSSRIIPAAGPPREVINESICISGKVFKFCAATVGNPHCILITDEPSAFDAQ